MRTSFARSYDRAGVEENVCRGDQREKLGLEDEHLRAVVHAKMRVL